MTDRRFSDNPELAAYTGTEIIPAQSIDGGTDTTSTPVAPGDDVGIPLGVIAPWLVGEATPATGPINEAKGTAIASAATTDIGAATGNLVHITGTTTITAFDTVQAGTGRTLVFDGALTLTHDAGSLILPTGANIITAAGDVGTFRSEGSGNWRCVGYMRADGTAVAGSGASDLTIVTEASAFTADPATHRGGRVLTLAAGNITFDSGQAYASGQEYNIRATAAIDLVESGVTLTPPAGGTLALGADMAVTVVMTGSAAGIVIGQTVPA